MTFRQTLFVSHYLETNGNATESARRAGYAFPNVTGTKLLVIASIREAIAERVRLVAMPADEVLARIGRLASIDTGNFLKFDPANPDEPPTLDFRKARRRDNLVGIKKLKQTTRRIPNGRDKPPIIEREVECEVNEPLKALALMAKYHGLVDKKEPVGDVTTKSDEELDRIIEG